MQQPVSEPVRGQLLTIIEQLRKSTENLFFTDDIYDDSRYAHDY